MNTAAFIMGSWLLLLSVVLILPIRMRWGSRRLQPSPIESKIIEVPFYGAGEDLRVLLWSIHNEPWNWGLHCFKYDETPRRLDGPGGSWITATKASGRVPGMGDPYREFTNKEWVLAQAAVASWRIYQFENDKTKG